MASWNMDMHGKAAGFDENEAVRRRDGENDRTTRRKKDSPELPGEKRGSSGSRRSKRAILSLVVDIILLCLLAGLLIGSWFGYRALKNIYAPVWEKRPVVFCVEMENIDPEMVKYGQDGRPVFVNHPMWSSPSADADRIGVVTDVRTVLVAWEDGHNTLTLYLTVEGDARYRRGQGYYMGETRLLSGTEGQYRMEGMSGKGCLISLREKGDETDTDTGDETVWVEPTEHTRDPEAEG